MKERTARIIKLLKESKKKAAAKNAVIGFDGFVDEIVRVVKYRGNVDNCAFFQTISEFSEHLSNAAGKSADIELVTSDIKLGGNAPIMANALAWLDVNTVCIGAMGFQEENEAFRRMHEKCRKVSICDPGYTHAFEFKDGKLMFANLTPLEKVSWINLKEVVGLDHLIEMFDRSDLIAFVNWSIIYNAQTIWEGVYREVFPRMNRDSLSRKTLFFDLADPTKRSQEDIKAVVGLISKFSNYCNVVVGLNENEANRVYNALKPEENTDAPTLEEKGTYIFNHLNIHLLLIHPVNRCIAVNRDGVILEQGKVVQNPKITTGGGDNFNAGYCFGTLLGFDIADSMLLGMAASGCYVRNGHSPSSVELVEYLLEWED